MTKSKMIEFILSFDKYPTMNSWNNSYSYSYNVKIHSLPLNSEQRSKAYELMEAEGFYDEFNSIIEEWQDDMKKHGTHREKREMAVNVSGLPDEDIQAKREQLEARGWTYDRHGTAVMTVWRYIDEPLFNAGFNGRSGGHLVLYKWNGHNWAGTGWAHDMDELHEMSADEVKYIYSILRDFQRLYKSLLGHLLYMIENMSANEEEYTIKRTRKILKDKNE